MARYTFLLLIFLLPFASLSAQGETENISKVLLVYPDLPIPVDLQQNWWNFFSEPDSDELAKRIDAIEKALEIFQSQVDEAVREEAKSYIKRLLYNLQLYLILKRIQMNYPLEGFVHKKKYTFSEFLELANSIYSIKNKRKVESLVLEQQKSILDNLKQSLLNQAVLYYQYPPSSSDRYLNGLEIMAERARYAYLEEKYSLVRQTSEIQKKAVTRLSKELEGALQKIEYTPEEEAKFQETIHDLQIKLDRAYLNIVDLETRNLEQQINQEFTSSATNLIDQDVVYSTIKYSRIKTDIVSNSAALMLIDIKQDGSFDVDKIQKQFEEWDQFYQTTKNMVKTWDQLLVIDRDVIGKQWLEINQSEEDESIEAFRQRYEKALQALLDLESTTKNLYFIELVLNLIENEMLSAVSLQEKVGFHFHEALSYIFQLFRNVLYFSLFEINEFPVTLFSILKIIIILISAYFISRFVQTALDRIVKKRTRITQPTIYTLKYIVHYAILTIALLIAFFSIGLNLDNIAIVLGALGIGIGFGLQNIVNNFLSGIAILFERNVKIGDYVELESGHFGKVLEINVQNATVRTFDGLDILVPNSKLIATRLVNWTKKDPYQRLRIPFGVAYGTDQDFVREVIIKAASEAPSTLSEKHGLPDPSVWFVEFGESSLNFQLVVWVNIRQSVGRTSLRALYSEIILRALKENGIKIPFPQRDVHIIKENN